MSRYQRRAFIYSALQIKIAGYRMIPGNMGMLDANAVMMVQFHQCPKIFLITAERKKQKMKARMVTRTVKQTELVCKVANTETETISTETVTIPGIFKDEKKLTKAAHAAIDNDVIKVISIVSTTVKDCLYGMSEADFIANAKILPDRKTH